MARPTKMMKETVTKLEQGFCYGFNITEACDYAGISRLTYYRWLAKNTEFCNKMSRAQTDLQRRAKINLAGAIENGDIELSKYYLERKCKDEFSTQQDIKVTGNINTQNPFEGLSAEELKTLAEYD